MKADGTQLRRIPAGFPLLHILATDYCSFSMDIPKIAESAVSSSLAYGLLHGETVSGHQYFTHMPFSLFPFPVLFILVSKVDF